MGRRGVAILFALTMIARACLSPIAASAGEGGNGDGGGNGGPGPGGASGPGPGGNGGAGAGANGAGDGSGAAAGTSPGGGAPAAVGHASDAGAGEKGVADEIEAALANAGHWFAARPSRSSAESRKARSPAAMSLPAPLRWLTRNASRSLAHAAGVANNASGAALGGPLAWLGARIHATTSDQDSAREAVNRGQIVPLAAILKTVQKSVPGDVLKIALNREVAGSWSYSITVLTPQGYYRDVNVDAGSNQITQIKGH